MTYEERAAIRILINNARRQQVAQAHAREAAHTFTVRADALLCTYCNTWKPDEQFPRNQRAQARRQRHAQCRPCQKVARMKYRVKVGIFS